MLKSLFRFGSHAFIIITLLSHLFSFGRHEEEKREEKKCSKVMSVLALVASVAALGFLFDEKRRHEHHLF